MLKVGLTGGIGSGKSMVAEAFRAMGVPVFDADKRARQLVNESAEIRKRITSLFGDESYVHGEYNRAFIASIVFSDEAKLSLLNELIHPHTIADAERWFQNQQYPYAVKEAAILFESGANKYVDFVIGVSAPMELRISRVMQRDGITAAQVTERINRQMNEADKMKQCDHVIINDEKNSIVNQVLEIHEFLLKKSQHH